MNKLQQKLLDLKISKKLPFWCIAPALIICVFVIVFAVTGAKTDAATGFLTVAASGRAVSSGV